jgi:pimeloyl-ACP methyl ester carboxylesterase
MPRSSVLPVALSLALGGAGGFALARSQTIIQGPAGRLAVDDGGSGDDLAVVFIHSLAGSGRQWEPQLIHLRRTRRAVALDLRGHGRSEAPANGELGLDGYASDVRAAMDALRISRAVLVGHSLGGGVAVAFAGLWPERAPGLFLVDPIDDPSKRPPDGASESFVNELDGPDYEKLTTVYWTKILEFAGSKVREQVLADLKATPRRIVTGSMRAMLRFDARAALVRYRGPVLTITTPLNDYPSSLQNVIPGIRHEKMSGVSHWLHLDRPDEFNATLDRFLAQIRH